MDNVAAPVHGVMWCTAHSGIADECNTGDECDQADGEQDCELVELFYWKNP